MVIYIILFCFHIHHFYRHKNRISRMVMLPLIAAANVTLAA